MAETVKQIDFTELIMQHVRNGENFLLSGGAGSGKTYSLVSVLRKTIEENPCNRVACITYTNNAVNEIKQRVDHPNLFVSTIHDFLWENIKNFQKELQVSLPIVINTEQYKKTKFNDTEKCEPDYFLKDNIEIEYSEYLNLKKGRISHDQLLELSHYMFATYPLLCRMIRDRYPVILIDEYQDSAPLVVEILLNCLSPAGSKDHCVVGFFGDEMQAIYDTGVGDLNVYKENGQVHEVKKEFNYRNPQRVIELANKLRVDKIVQIPALDANAKNNENGKIKEGRITFLYSDELISNEMLRSYIASKYNWDFTDCKVTKELHLTHNMIAGDCGFSTLIEIFNEDPILSYCKKFGKQVAKAIPDIDCDGKTFGEIYDRIKGNSDVGYTKPTDREKNFIDIHPSIWEMARNTDFTLLTNTYIKRDDLIDDIKDNDEDGSIGGNLSPIIKHLYRIQECINLYESEHVGRFLWKTGRKLYSSSDRKELKAIMDGLIAKTNLTIEDVITYADHNRIRKFDDNVLKFMTESPYIYNRVKKVPYEEFIRLTEYVHMKTPFSTQHKTKGSEFPNVLVIMNNGAWTKYNFDYLMGALPPKPTKSNYGVLNRTKKLFYVCCSRAMNHLVVYFPSPNSEVLATAKSWFGEDNIERIPSNE